MPQTTQQPTDLKCSCPATFARSASWWKICHCALLQFPNVALQKKQSSRRLVLLHLPALVPGSRNITAPSHTPPNLDMCQTPSWWPIPSFALFPSSINLHSSPSRPPCPSVIPYSLHFWAQTPPVLFQSFLNCLCRNGN